MSQKNEVVEVNTEWQCFCWHYSCTYQTQGVKHANWSYFYVALSLITFKLQNYDWLMVKKYFILKYFAMCLEVQKWCALP